VNICAGRKNNTEKFNRNSGLRTEVGISGANPEFGDIFAVLVSFLAVKILSGGVGW